MKHSLFITIFFLSSCSLGYRSNVDDLGMKLKVAEYKAQLAKEHASELRKEFYRAQLVEIRKKISSFPIADPVTNLETLFHEERKILSEMIEREKEVKDEAEEVLNHLLRLITQLNSYKFL